MYIINSLLQKVKAEKRKEAPLKKKLANVRKVARVSKPRKKRMTKKKMLFGL